jgi:tetratricopeptide (TPR) repeat protein
MNPLKHSLLLLILGIPLLTVAQRTTVFSDANASYKKANNYFDKGVFGKAMTEYEKTIQLIRPANEPELEMILRYSELGYAKSAVRMNLPDGEKLMLDFIRRYSPDPIANEALIEVANYYYNSRKYKKALEYFALIPTYQLNKEQKSEVRFKMGYANFVQQKFREAKNNFNQIKDIENRYYFPTNYYLGMCDFFSGNYSSAVKSFSRVEKSKRYKPYIPYYLSQIYFAQGEYDQLIYYAERKLKDDRVRNLAEINQLVGQAYFEKGDYERALPYLEYYADEASKLREEEFYQLGFVQHQTGETERLKKAIRNFEQVADVDSELGQSALYYIGDAQLKLNNKAGARVAFGRASRMNYDPTITEEAQFNYAKLSYELGFDTDAINTLQSITSSSKYYTEAQTLMSEIFQNTKNYERALVIIENIPNRTPQLKEAYQKVAYYRGMQLFKDKQYDSALEYFTKSNRYPIDLEIKASTTYWMGDIAHRKKDYKESIRLMNQFLTMSKALRDLPDESSSYTANYTQGYNYLKQENYTTALGYFQDAIASVSRNKPFIRSRFVKEDLLGDATLRAGDCYFKRNRYTEAIRFYDQAIANRYDDFIYALYQKAIIEGLRGNQTEKVIALENIVDNYPKSAYADDALLALGITYQEIGQLNSATGPLRKLVSQYAGSSDLIVQGLLRLGLISFNQGNLQTAMEYYKKVFSHNPNPQEAKDALAALEEIYIDNLSDPEGYARFLKTIPGYELDQTGRDSLTFKAAEAQYENGNFDRAIKAYDDYIRKFPNSANRLIAQYHRGESFFELQQYPMALSDFEYVINRGSSRYYTKALRFAALISYNYTQDFQKAYEYYSKLESTSLDEDVRFEAQIGAMQSAYRINNSQAVFEMARKVANNPSSSLEQKATANFYLGKMAYDNKDYDSAMSAFTQVVQITDQEEAAEARYLIASIHYLRRDLTTAERFANQAIRDNSGYAYWVAKTMLLLADVYADLGDLFNARAVLEALLEGYDGDAQIINEAQSKLDQISEESSTKSRLDDSDEFEMEDDDGTGN